MKSRPLSAHARWQALRSGGLVPVPMSSDDALLDVEDVGLRREAGIDPDRFDVDGDLDAFEDELVDESVEAARTHSSTPVGGPPEPRFAPVPTVSAPAAAPLLPAISSHRDRRPPPIPRHVRVPSPSSQASTPTSPSASRVAPWASLLPSAPTWSSPVTPASSPRGRAAEDVVYRRVVALASRQWATEGETARMLAESERIMGKARALGRPPAEIAEVGMSAARRVAPILPKQGMLVPALAGERPASPALLAAARLGEDLGRHPSIRWVAQSRRRRGLDVIVGPGRLPRIPRRFENLPVRVVRQPDERPPFGAALASARRTYEGKPNVVSVTSEGETIVVRLASPYSSTTVQEVHEGWPVRVDVAMPNATTVGSASLSEPSTREAAAGRLRRKLAKYDHVYVVAASRHHDGIDVVTGPGEPFVERIVETFAGYPVRVMRMRCRRGPFERAFAIAQENYGGEPGVYQVSAEGETIVVWLDRPDAKVPVGVDVEGWPVRVESLRGSGARLPTPKPTGGGKLMPIFEPAHNLREVAKQLTLLEDHLVQSAKRCPDCIRKHLLTAEALAEEAASLDKTGRYRSITGTLPQRLRGVAQRFLSGADKAALAQDVRAIRKALSKASFGAVMMDTTAIVSADDARLGDDLDDDDRVGDVSLPSSSRATSGGVAGLSAGQEVLFAEQDADGSASWLRGLRRGRIVGAGETVAGYAVASVPQVDAQGTWYALRDVADGTEAWRTASFVLPLAADPAGLFSELLAGRGATRYHAKNPGSSYHFVVDGKMARMADLVQAAFFRTLQGRWCPAPSGSSTIRTDLPACQFEVPRKLALAATINAIYESHMNPEAVGDSGRAVGLFQLHEAGAGKGMTAASRKDPVVNAETIAKVALRAMANPRSELNRLARAEVDGVSEPISKWAAAFSREVERPSEADAEALNRARTAAQLLGETEAAQTAASVALRAVAPELTAMRPSPVSSSAPSPVPSSSLTMADLDVVARDTARLARFRQAWFGDYGVRGAVQDALDAEGRSLADAATRWRALATRTGDEWALLRAIALSVQSGDAPGAYQAFGALIGSFPRSPFLEVAHVERARMERVSPRAYLNAPPPGAQRKLGWAVAGGTLAAAALLAAASLTTSSSRPPSNRVATR